MKRSLLNNLGDVPEVTVFLVSEWTEETIPGRKGENLVATCNQLEFFFLQKEVILSIYSFYS